MSDPWYKTTFHYSALGLKLTAQVPHDVFSTQRIDEGTLLLLEHLPASSPKLVLDMGCGYGALGLPVAAKFPRATVEMVDRDLLAVKWSKQNAVENQLSNIDAYGSLGFRDVKQNVYDWILCNVPARIGTPFIQNLMEVGSSKLSDEGDLRIVVINDLSPVLKELKEKLHWKLDEVAVGPRHTIFSMKKSAATSSEVAPVDLYLRDTVKASEFMLDRPFDIGGDDQKRLQTSLPILIDAMPRQALPEGQNILCFRGLYGAIPLLASKRSPKAQVISVDRDLLGTTFTRHNAEKLGLLTSHLEIREAAHFPEGLAAGEKFDLILGEASSSAGRAVAEFELTAITALLRKGGQALILCLEKNEKEWVPAKRILTREGFSVLRMSV